MDAVEPSGSAHSASEALTVPFASVVELADSDVAALHDAVETATASCMAAAGFTYDPQPFTSGETPPPLFGNLTYARASGYGIVDALAVSGAPLGDSHDPAWRQALLGTATFDQLSDASSVVSDAGGMRVAVDPESCASQARSAVYGDDLAWQQAKARITYLQHLTYTEAVGDRASADPEWTGGVAAWQTCMTERGYDLPGPLAAIPALTARVQAEGADLLSLRAEEVDVATADATCVQATGLDDLARRRLADTEARVAAGHPEPLATYEALVGAAVERAHPAGD